MEEVLFVKKRLISLLFAVTILCTSSFAINKEGPSNTVVQINEFENLITQTSGSTERIRLNEAKDTYCDAIRTLTKYDNKMLLSSGYSNAMISLIEKFRDNPNYDPSTSELTEAAPTITFYCSAFTASSAANRTDVTFKWTFKWSDAPTIGRTDVIGAYWNHQGMTVERDSYEITLSNGRTYDNSDNIAHMETEINEEEQYIYQTFPIKLDNTLAYCQSGRGEFTLHLNERVTSVQLSYGYGHQIEDRLASITIGVGYGYITFGKAYETYGGDVKTFYVN